MPDTSGVALQRRQAEQAVALAPLVIKLWREGGYDDIANKAEAKLLQLEFANYLEKLNELANE